MAKVTIGLGIVLIVQGLLGYLVIADADPETGKVSMTALIPAFFGVPFLLLGLIALNDSARKIAMHVAVVIGLLGLVGSLMRPAMKLFSGEGVSFNAAVAMQLIMAALCLVFLVLCVRSFIAARQSGIAGAS
jgi:hypothetical protein